MRKILIAVFAAFIALGFMGCYDNNETDTLATVMAVGVDKSENEGIKSYTFAVADTAGFSGGSKGDGASLVCFTSQGEDVDRAIRDLDTKISKKLSFSHLSALLFSDNIATDGMYDEVNYFEKKISVRPQTMIAITDIDAGEYLKSLKPTLEANPEKYFQSIFQRSSSYVPNVSISDFTNAYHTASAVLVPVITAHDGQGEFTEESSFISQSALVYEGRVIEKIADTWLAGLFLSTKEVVYNSTVLRSVRAPEMSVDMQGGIPVVKARLFLESQANMDYERLQADIELKLTEYAQRACDIIDVNALAKKSFLLWEDYKKYDFEKIIKTTRFNVSVEPVSGE